MFKIERTPIYVAIFCFLIFVPSGYSKVFYVSVKGNLSAKGTKADPLPFSLLQECFKKNGGGDTYIFLPANYIAQQIDLFPENRGTPANPTILKSEYKYKAKLQGAARYNIYVHRGCDWVIIDGFAASGAFLTGIKSNADETVIRNCWIHNNSLQGIESHSVFGSVIEYNLIEFNGKNIQYDHGVYASGAGLIIRGNIVRYNAGHGLHLYEKISRSRVESNLIYGNNRSGILAWSPETGGHNYILNNTIVDNGYAFSFVNASGNVIANNLIVNNDRSREHIKNDFDFHADPNKLADVIISTNLVSPEVASFKSKNISAKPLFYDQHKKVFFLTNFTELPPANKKYMAQTNFFGVENDSNTTPYFGCFPYYKQEQIKDLVSAYYYGWPFASYNDPKNSEFDPPDLWRYKTK